MERIFDFHFHLLFKHYIGLAKEGKELSLDQNLETKGVAKLLNEVLGGPFDSQSSPAMVKDSPLFLGVTSILSVEHAFANRVLHVLGLNLSGLLPLKRKIFEGTRDGAFSYYEEFNRQVDFHLKKEQELLKNYNIGFLHRKNWVGKTEEEIERELSEGSTRWLAFSIEGGHNLSDVPIRGGVMAKSPELRLKELQEREDIDFMSINLCHLSHIPEQPLGGFAQGLNGLSQIAFSSEDFMPRTGLGLTELGKKVVRQALGHTDRPLLIDVKHMSLYTRLDFYKYREELIKEMPQVERLPIISSHTGFTFTTVEEYLSEKRFKSSIGTEAGKPISIVEPENRRIGRTDDRLNKRLYANPWTINLFDEEIVEIMQSGGMIGISLDQRILGASNPGVDSLRDKYFEGEYVARPEWERLFRDGKLPGAEKEAKGLESLTPTKEERHMMLLCLHLVHAVRVGYANLNWVEGTSPWDHLCIGSDFDGLVNPINGIGGVPQLGMLNALMDKYLPQADKSLVNYPSYKALQYHQDGTVEGEFLKNAIEGFLFRNGKILMLRYLRNF